MYTLLLDASPEALSSCTFRDSQSCTLSFNNTHTDNLYCVNTRVVKKYCSYPIVTHRLLSPSINSMNHSLSAKFTHHHFGHASRQRIQQMDKLGILTGIPNSITKIYHHFYSCVISKGPILPCNLIFYRTSLSRHLLTYLLQFFNKISCQKITPSLIISDSTTRHLFGYPTK